MRLLGLGVKWVVFDLGVKWVVFGLEIDEGDCDDGLSKETVHSEEECRAMVLTAWNMVVLRMFG